MSRFDQMDNGNPAEQSIKAKAPNVGRSAHDFSTSVAGNALIGALIPVDCFDVVPSEKVQVSISAQVEFRNPTTRPLLNGFRTYFHVRYNRLTDLWEGAKNFIDHGRSGDINLTMPNLIYRASYEDGTATVSANANTPLSLLDYLHLPPESIQVVYQSTAAVPIHSFKTAFSNTSSSAFTVRKINESTNFFPAPVAMAYQRNWRDFYCNKNLLQGNKYWFPDNEDHFILSYNCENAVCVNYENEDMHDYSDYHVGSKEEAQVVNLTGGITANNRYTRQPNNPSAATNLMPHGVYPPNLAGIKFVQFRGDRFTTSSPFPDLIRGDTPVLQLTQDEFVHSVVTHSSNPSEVGVETPIDGKLPVYSGAAVYRSTHMQSLGNPDDEVRFGLKMPPSSVTMSDLYTLETLTAFKRKMGMTNGDYNEAVKAQFGHDPHVHTREATYIGGFYVDMGISTVVQQSQSDSTPLGTKAGNGLSAGRGNIGDFTVPDYGYISVYMFTVPNVYYTQGKPRMWSKNLSTDFYYPLFNNLPAQAIRNDELYISGNPTVDAAPFSYEDRYAEYKSRTNYVCGFMGLSPSSYAYDAAKIMARRFSQTPTFNHYFVSLVPENQDMSVFVVTDEPPLDFLVNINVRRVFPGPYVAIEGSLSSPALNS